jgi:glutamate formiminotransferase / 5-formyltetrahydrofolate cyclo-ligase
VNDRDARWGAQAAPVLDRRDPPLPPAPPRPVALAVPNVSEGRDEATIRALVDACAAAGARVLDRHSDADHHRTVLSVAGDPLAVQDAMVALAAEALERIDLRRHRGAHPRVGALDVVPIVALTPDDMPLAQEVAMGLSERIGAELNLPVFRYGEVAATPERTRPHDFRSNGLEWLAREVEEGRIAPDAGPARLHPSAGGVLVGARYPLIAWNVWLPEGTLPEARTIAARVREAGGGPVGVRALGLYMPEAGAAQVSMNLEDLSTTPAAAVAAVRREAERLGVAVGDSELVGLIPGAALRGQSPSALRLPSFRPGQVVEAKLPALRRS